MCPFSRPGRPGVPGQYRGKREAQIYAGGANYGGEFQYCNPIADLTVNKLKSYARQIKIF